MSEVYSTPYHYLCALAARAEGGGTLPSLYDKNTNTWSGIGFQAAGLHCVAPLGEITEILHEPHCTRLPGVQPWVKGVANVRGRLLPLIDFNLFLGLAPCHRGKVLVLEQGEFYAGLVVEEVYGMQHFDSGRYDDKAALPDVGISRYLRGCYRQDEREWLVFRPNRLLNDKAFFLVAA